MVDEPPRHFEVGNHGFEEAGHYSPSDGSITLNDRVVSSASAYNGIIAHEVMHDKWHVVHGELTREHKAIAARIDKDPTWYDKTFTPGGKPRTEEAKAELENDYPVSALFGRTVGDAYLDFGGSYEKAKKDDGVSKYSDAYWSPEALEKNFSMQTAYNETLAEIARLDAQGRLHSGTSYQGDKRPSRRWRGLYNGINKEYKRLRVREP